MLSSEILTLGLTSKATRERDGEISLRYSRRLALSSTEKLVNPVAFQRSANALDELAADGIRNVHEYDRYGLRRSFRVGGGPSNGDQYVRLQRHELGRHAREQLGLLVRKSVFES